MNGRRERNWNIIIGVAALAFAVLVAIVVLGHVYGDNENVGDDAVFLTAVGGIMALLLNQVHHGDQIARTERKIEQVYEHVNNVEEQEAIPDDGEPERPTLGSLLRTINGKVDDVTSHVGQLAGDMRSEFTTNSDVHDELLARIDALEHPSMTPPTGATVPPAARPPARRPSKRRKP